MTVSPGSGRASVACGRYRFVASDRDWFVASDRDWFAASDRYWFVASDSVGDPNRRVNASASSGLDSR